MKRLTYLAIGAIACLHDPANAQTVAGRVIAIDGQVLPGSLLIPAGVGAGVGIYQQVNTPNAHIRWDDTRENRHTIFGDRKSCAAMGRRNGFGRLLDVINHGNGKVTCIFSGKQTSFGGGN
jgi:hypothetical protein